MATSYNVIINVAANGTRVVQRNLQDIGDAAISLHRRVELLNRAMKFFALGLGVGKIVEYIDTYTNLQNKLALVTNGTANLNAVTNELFNVAGKTRTSFEATSTLYSRMAAATQNMGLSQEQLIGFTTSLNKAVIVSGATAIESANAMRQFAQGMAKGRLDGDELRSVLEQLPYVADVIAKKMGVTRYELRELGKQGKITPQIVMDAFTNMSSEIDAAFAKTTPTISQSLQVLSDGVMKMLGEWDKSSGASVAFAKGLLFVRDNLETIASGFLVAAAAAAAFFAPGLIVAGITAIVSGVVALTAALIANPIGAFLAIVVGGVTAFAAFGKSIDDTVEKLGVTVTVLDRIRAVWVAAYQYIVTVWQNLPHAIEYIFKSTFNKIGQWAVNIVNKLAEIAPGETYYKYVFNPVEISADAMVAGAKAGAAFKNALEDALKEAGQKPSNIVGALGQNPGEIKPGSGADKDAKNKQSHKRTFNDYLRDMLNEVEVLKASREEREYLNKVMQIEHSLKRALIPAEKELVKGLQDYIKELKNAEILEDLNQDLEREMELLQLSNRERTIATQLYQYESQLKRALSEDERATLTDKLKFIETLKLEDEWRKKTVDAVEELAAKQEALNTAYSKGWLNAEYYTNSLIQLRAQQAQLALEMGNSTDEFNDYALVGFGKLLEGYRGVFVEMGEIAGNFLTQTSQGFSNAVSQWIVQGGSLRDIFGQVAQTILQTLIGALIQMGVQWLLVQALGSATQTTQTTGALAGIAATTAASVAATTAITTAQVAAAATIAAAYAPAAAMASLASFGANAIPAEAGILAVSATAQLAAMPIPGFMEGGYTGDGATNKIAGVTHGQEFVMNAEATRRIGVDNLYALQNGTATMNSGTSVDGTGTVSTSSGIVVNIENYGTSKEFEVEQLSESEVRIIARDEARQAVQRDAPSLVAAEVRNPNSKVSKSLSRSTTTSRRR